MARNLAFLGLGTMGYPMAGHLKKAGEIVTVYNRTLSKAERWVDEYLGELRITPREAVVEADIVFICVGNDNDVRDVVYGADGVLAALKAGTIVVDHTTTSAALARELSDAITQRGGSFVDAPVSGGEIGAKQGCLTIMVGGDSDIYQDITPVLDIYARCVKRLGDVGAGQLCKMVNQICVTGLIQSLSEGVLFAKKAGLDVGQVIDVISQGAAQSWQMDNRAKTMIEGEYQFGFAVDWMIKDLAIVIDECQRMDVDLPLVGLVIDFYREVQAMGGGRWDTSSLLARLEQQNV